MLEINLLHKFNKIHIAQLYDERCVVQSEFNQLQCINPLQLNI
jgi:hypothetical protein